ncbi:MAG: hypothetical protein WCO12_01355 [bacterium]
MFNFFHKLGIGIVSAFVAFTGSFHTAPIAVTQTGTSSASEIVDTSSVVSHVQKEETKKSAAIDNSAEIQAQVQLQLKAKAEQDALIAKQKADEQAKLDAQKAEADRVARINTIKAQQAIDRANEDARNAQAQIDSQRQAKQEKLDAVNLKIANLNAKYAADIKAARSGGATLEQSDAFVRDLNSRYTADYDALQAEYQQIQYSN